MSLTSSILELRFECFAEIACSADQVSSSPLYPPPADPVAVKRKTEENLTEEQFNRLFSKKRKEMLDLQTQD